jgi:segregation and condensation protein B
VRPDQIVEATLFASQTPLTPEELARADESLDPAEVEEAIRALRERYEQEDHAFQIYQLGDGFQVLTRPEFAPYLERFDSVPRPPHLSAAALETLAIVAYRQPIGRIEIEEVRGVSASSVLKTLLDWELVTVVGRGEGLGRPLLYGTTERFLEHFGLASLSELPPPEELPVALGAPTEPGSSAEDTGSGAEATELAPDAPEAAAEADVAGDPGPVNEAEEDAPVPGEPAQVFAPESALPFVRVPGNDADDSA